ncbi:glycerophosphocholine phosphodiesterase GPCPD1-like [Rhopilema esculentum]|uniref:glycerophosphocholine phosphodiesterase GPCPD1-like n=1 Tax=Rhopilema esculentum TaxID=499914 RepID=UPI0031D6D1B9
MAMSGKWLEHDSELHIYFDDSSFEHFPNILKASIKSNAYFLGEKDQNDIIHSKVKKLPGKEGQSVEILDSKESLLWERGDFVAYVFRLEDFKNTVLHFEICTDFSSCKEFSFPYSMLEKLYGSMKVSLHGKNNDNEIGSIKFNYLIINPWRSDSVPRDSLLGLQPQEWHPFEEKERHTLNIGHRGCGVTNGQPISQGTPIENTIASFRTAFDNGADFVELDVQLSKDSVPVVFHDFYANIQAKQSTGCTTKMTIPVSDMTLENMRTFEFMLKDDKGDFPHDKPEKGVLFPSLEEVFTELPKDLGIFVEAKYPMQNIDKSWEANHFPDKCKLVEKILEVIFKHGKDRRIILGSFDPGICIMFRLKQPRYRVVFISSCENDVWEPLFDARCRSWNMALNFAKTEGLLGISVFADPIIDSIHDRQRIAQNAALELFTWGCPTGANTEIRCLELQRRSNIAGVIYDRLNELK